MKFSAIFCRISAFFLILSTLCGCASLSDSQDTSFTRYTNDLFCTEVSSDSLTLHYTLADQASFGISRSDTSLSELTTDATAFCAALENVNGKLASFQPQKLSTKNQLTLEILQSYFRSSYSLAPYLLYEEPLNAVTGVQAQLPILLAEYRLESKDDVLSYLHLLEQTKQYFLSLANFETAKANAGLFMSKKCAEDVISQCNTFLSLGEENFLFSTFEERLRRVPNLSDEEKDAFLTRNHTLIFEQLYPGYRFLVTELENLKSASHNENGLCHLPGGKEYYEKLAASATSSALSVPSMKLLILKQIADDLKSIQSVIQPTQSPVPGVDTSQLPATPADIFSSLTNSMKQVFPFDGANHFSYEEATVKQVPNALCAYLSPAFYLTPPIDRPDLHTIYINQGSTADGLELYTTLAHEGYPGHLYQNSFFLSTEPDPIRCILGFPGYTEGWATYGEMCSYYFAGLPDTQATFIQHYHSLLLGLYAYADIGVHYDGWTLEEMSDYFQDYGIANASALQEIYTLILSDPANYLTYDVGYLEFLELKKEAISTWGDDFSELRFHQFLLETGPCSFETLNERL